MKKALSTNSLTAKSHVMKVWLFTSEMLAGPQFWSKTSLLSVMVGFKLQGHKTTDKLHKKQKQKTTRGITENNLLVIIIVSVNTNFQKSQSL